MIGLENIFAPYTARKLTASDIPDILALYLGNPEYYRHCPPSPDRESVREDMLALPPGKEAGDKYFIGLFDGDGLAAVLDLIDRYPDDETAFIGLLMVAKDLQGHGVGTFLVKALSEALRAGGYARIRLGYMKTHCAAARFWHGQGFQDTGGEAPRGDRTIVAAEKRL